MVILEYISNYLSNNLIIYLIFLLRKFREVTLQLIRGQLIYFDYSSLFYYMFHAILYSQKTI